MIYLATLLAATATAGAHDMPETRAIAMQVEETEDAVIVELIATSAVAQHITYDIEVAGSSRSKHRGTTTISAKSDTVLSRFKVSHSGTWCASANVTEENGLNYTLKAGDCRTGGGD